jgi:hypothetical protein
MLGGLGDIHRVKNCIESLKVLYSNAGFLGILISIPLMFYKLFK